jgi:asparagine synthase (glutamine-hydrolysing)
LQGAFALALWDDRLQRMICARDHFGRRPLYYYVSDDLFAFASRIQPLLRLREVSATLNEMKVADFLMQTPAEPAATFYEDIRRVSPAHYLGVTPENVVDRPYWQLDKQGSLELSTGETCSERYRALFTRAVDRHFGDGQVGCLLSGGLDSSSVVCVARTLLDDAGQDVLDTFSAVFDGIPRSDERKFIEAVTRDQRIRSHTVAASRLHPLEPLEELLDCVEEPFLTPNLYLHWYLLQTARAAGVDIVFDGFLGDNVVGHGSRFLTELAATARWWQLWRELHAAARQQGSRREVLPRLFKRFVWRPFVQEPASRLGQRLTGSELPQSPASDITDHDFLRGIGWVERVKARGVFNERTPRAAREVQYGDLTSGTLQRVVEIAHKVAAARRVDLRFPFADRDLMEFCMAVPACHKCKGGRTRAYARDGLADLLPPEIRRRRDKASLHPALTEGLFVRDRARFEALLFESLSVAEDYVDVAAVHATYRRYQAGAARESVVWPLWRVAVLSAWLGRDPPSPAAQTLADNHLFVSSTAETQKL